MDEKVSPTREVDPATLPSPRMARRVLISSFVGSVVEWYDYLLFGTASALVFNKIFFTNLDPAVGTIAAFASLAVGNIARPLGGIIFGHFGDRLGRKKLLIISIMMMGVATVLIGLLPTYNQVGILAPLLLVTLRLVQGAAVGGEWGGAVLMTLEHAKAKRRGLWSSMTQIGAPTGLLLSTIVFALFSTLPEDQFLSWGWRVPFLLTTVLIGIGIWMRASVEESPVFRRAQEAIQRDKDAANKEGLPIVQVLRRPRAAVLASLIGFGPYFANAILLQFVVTYAAQAGFDRTTALVGLMVGSVSSMAFVPVFAALSDKVGRRPVYLAGAVLLGANSFLLFPLVNTGSTALLLLAFGVAMALHALMYGPMAAFMAELFGARTRYTGTSIGYQVAAVAGGFSPTIGAFLLERAGGPPHSMTISLLMAAALALTAVAAFITPETNRNDLDADPTR
jgi:MFS transporter, MHS family, shikimate and dehydroshikimate transport protein